MKTLPPFNLEAAKRGEPVIQRCGREARILAFDSRVGCGDARFPLVVEYLNSSGEFEINSFTEDGEITPTIASDADLFMAPRKEKRWILSWIDEHGVFRSSGFTRNASIDVSKKILHEQNCTNIQVTEIEVEL